MNYTDAISFLYAQFPQYQQVGGSAYKPGLANVERLSEAFGNPHKKLTCIHVGGTNGKGSTSHTLAAILQSQGYKVGLFTSPHLLDFRERIRVDGKEVEQSFVVDFVKQYQHTSLGAVKPSFFELTTVMAFCYFVSQQVDYAVIEVGLGGRLDSTNIVRPILSIVTNISLDHTQYLGNTVEKIAYEKAGIIKRETPIIVGEADAIVRKVFMQVASQHNAPLHFAQDCPLVLDSSFVEPKGILYTTKEYVSLYGELGGEVQRFNTNTILCAVQILQQQGVEIGERAIRMGFSEVTQLTGLQGRWQQLQMSPRVICDTAHNVAGVAPVMHQVVSQQYHQLHIVWGMVSDKDVSSVLKLLPKGACFYFCKANIDRAMSCDELCRQAKEVGLEGDAYGSVREAFEEARKVAVSDDLIFVGGSTFVVAEVLALFRK